MTADEYGRLERLAQQWSVRVDRVTATPSALVAFGARDGHGVVLKVVRQQSDEWRCGEMMRALGESSCVRVIEYVEGAALMERLTPGTTLSGMVERGDDDGATRILASVIAAMTPSAPAPGTPTALDWSAAFDRYLATADRRIPRSLVEHARDEYRELCASERAPRLLHGDIHHENLLRDERHGWRLIDPKGIVGEIELELATMMHNPWNLPELWTRRETVERRLAILAECLTIDIARARRWCAVHAVLSATWSAEDGEPVDPEMPVLRLAHALQ